MIHRIILPQQTDPALPAILVLKPGNKVSIAPRVVDENDNEVIGIDLMYFTSDDTIVELDGFGGISALRPGRAGVGIVALGEPLREGTQARLTVCVEL
jgi:hypothetical protein